MRPRFAPFPPRAILLPAPPRSLGNLIASVGCVVWLVFAVGSTLVGVGGALIALRDTASPFMGVQPVLAAFIAVFLGGIGSIPGAVVGGLVLGLAENMGGLLLPGHWQGVIAFVVLFLVLVFRPAGLLGAAAR